MKSKEKSPLEAVFLYYGILEAYEDVGKELIGEDVIEKHVIRKMAYYINQFIKDFVLPESEGELTQNLLDFLRSTKGKLTKAREDPKNVSFTNENVWELRAAIFGFESTFIEILGEHVIRDYVFSRIAEILTIYLPDTFVGGGSLEEKLESYTKYLQTHGLVKYAGYDVVSKGNKKSIVIRANKCIFAGIHDSDAYKGAMVRFCPWGMIGSAIFTSHHQKKTGIKSCQFVTRGTISYITIQDEI